jgi:hypothetical protein
LLVADEVRTAATYAGAIVERHLRRLARAWCVPTHGPDGAPCSAARLAGGLLAAGGLDPAHAHALGRILAYHRAASGGRPIGGGEVLQMLDAANRFFATHPVPERPERSRRSQGRLAS